MQGHKKGKNRPLQFPPGTMPQKPIVAFAGKARARPPVFCGVWVPHATQQKAAPRQKSWRAAGEKESNESDSNFPYLKQAILGHIYTSRRPETAKRRNESIMNHKYRQKTSQNSAKTPISAGFFSALSPGGIKEPARSGQIKQRRSRARTPAVRKFCNTPYIPE